MYLQIYLFQVIEEPPAVQIIDEIIEPPSPEVSTKLFLLTHI